MENKNKLETNKIENENIYLKNRKYISIDGILEILSSSENCILAKVKECNLIISGNNIHITKLDIENRNLEAEGNFETIKYSKSTNLFKRIFK